MEVLKKIKDYVNFENQDSKATVEVVVDREIQHHDRNDEDLETDVVEGMEDNENESNVATDAMTEE